jgi:uncharacterized C2H2 Zn-finger protein
MSGTRKKPSQEENTGRELLPVLVPMQPGERHDGVANFIRIVERHGTGTTTRSGPKVRLLRNRDLSNESITTNLSAKDRDLLFGALDLRRAYETDDQLLRQRAYQKLRPFLGNLNEFLGPFSEYAGWTHVHLPYLASEAIKATRLVLWFSRERGFSTAVYCPDMRTGIFVRALLNLNRCPHCGTVFVPTKNNQTYCSEAHGHAHRVARSRFRKGLKAKGAKGRRKI